MFPQSIMTDSLFQTDSGRNRSDTRSASNQHSRRTSFNQHSRRTSLNQHSRRTSISASVRSWLLSTQQHPPLPPSELAITPLNASRPLPEHPYSNMVQSQGPLTLPPFQVMNPSEDDFDNIGHDEARMYDGFMTGEVRRGQRRPPTQTAPGVQSEPRNRSFVGGFVRGLRTLPKKVLRYRGSAEKRRPALIAEEGESTEAVTTLPRYRSNPSIVGPSMVTYVQATDMPVPELHDRLPADALRSVRPRHPSYRVMPPPAHGLAEEQSAQVYDMHPTDPPTFQESTRLSTPPPEADRATTLIYDNPGDATTISGQPQSQSLRISYISHHTPNTHAPTPNPATPQYAPSQIASEIQENPAAVRSPVAARPPLSTDYRKMSLTSHEVTSPTTLTSSYSLEPSFSSELSPVKRFLHILHSLPWVSNERITSDYHPGGGSDKDLPKKKPLISWYRRPESSSGRNGSAPVDLLSPGSPDSRVARPLSNSSSGSPITSPTRSFRRTHSRLQPQRHQHRHQRHHRHHHHRHSHGRQRHRRSSPAAVDDEVPDVYRHNPAPPPGYPSPFPYPYPYPIPPAAPPRGPRSHRSPAYPGGYVPFHPMPPTPPPPQMSVASPLYVFTQSQGSIGDGFAGPGQPMYVVPGAFHPNHHAMASPSPSDRAANISPEPI